MIKHCTLERTSMSVAIDEKSNFKWMMRIFLMLLQSCAYGKNFHRFSFSLQTSSLSLSYLKLFSLAFTSRVLCCHLELGLFYCSIYCTECCTHACVSQKFWEKTFHDSLRKFSCSCKIFNAREAGNVTKFIYTRMKSHLKLC